VTSNDFYSVIVGVGIAGCLNEGCCGGGVFNVEVLNVDLFFL